METASRQRKGIISFVAAFAVAAADPQIKGRFIQIAEEWRRLADPTGPDPLPKDDADDVETALGAFNSA